MVCRTAGRCGYRWWLRDRAESPVAERAYLYTNETRRFYAWADDAKLQELLERHRGIGNTVELVEKEPEFRLR